MRINGCVWLGKDLHARLNFRPVNHGKWNCDQKMEEVSPYTMLSHRSFSACKPASLSSSASIRLMCRGASALRPAVCQSLGGHASGRGGTGARLRCFTRGHQLWLPCTQDHIAWRGCCYPSQASVVCIARASCSGRKPRGSGDREDASGHLPRHGAPLGSDAGWAVRGHSTGFKHADHPLQPSCCARSQLCTAASGGAPTADSRHHSFHCHDMHSFQMHGHMLTNAIASRVLPPHHRHLCDFS